MGCTPKNLPSFVGGFCSNWLCFKLPWWQREVTNHFIPYFCPFPDSSSFQAPPRAQGPLYASLPALARAIREPHDTEGEPVAMQLFSKPYTHVLKHPQDWHWENHNGTWGTLCLRVTKTHLPEGMVSGMLFFEWSLKYSNIYVRYHM